MIASRKLPSVRAVCERLADALETLDGATHIEYDLARVLRAEAESPSDAALDLIQTAVIELGSAGHVGPALTILRQGRRSPHAT